MMSLRIFVWLIFTFGSDCININSTILAQLPEMMSYLCPGADVCGKMYEAPDKSYSEGVCCTACSCESSCELKGNCCFPSKLPYTSDNIDFNVLPFYKRKCLYPTTLVLTKYQQLLYQPYYMITSVPSNVLCGDTKMSLWGSFYPVYSESRNEIYKNMACAIADGVTDGVLWDVILHCRFESQDGESFSFPTFGPLDNVNQVLEQGSYFVDWNCHVNFMLEGRNMESLKCYTDVIDHCPGSGLFQLPQGIHAASKEITDACSAGLVSPYRKNKMYANVFCFICNNETYITDNTCSQPSTFLNLRGPQGEVNFFGLIDTQISMEVGDKGKLSKIDKMTLACDNSKQNEKNCRRIHCPMGQMIDRFGKCKYFFSTMYDQLFYVIVNITTDVYLNFTELFGRNTMRALTSPWPEDWIIHSVIQIETQQNMSYTHLRIDLIREVRNIRTAHIMKIIAKYGNQGWILKTGNSSYILQSTLPTWDYVLSSDMGNILDDVIQIENRTRHLSFPSISNVFVDSHITMYIRRTAYQIISRLHYCKLVELNPSEFVFSKNKTALFNLRTQRLMFGIHSFEIKERMEIAEMRVRICIEDSGLSEENRTPMLIQLEALCVMWAFINRWIFFVMF